MPRKKPRIINRRDVNVEDEGVTSDSLSVIPDVDDEVKKNLVVHAGVAVKAPEPISLKLPIDREIQLIPEEAVKLECYPCPVCRSLFITSEGLEKHGRELHWERHSEILIMIHRIKKIWQFFREHGHPHDKERSPQEKNMETAEIVKENLEKPKPSKPDLCVRCGISFEKNQDDIQEYHDSVHEKNDELKEVLTKIYGQDINKNICDICDFIFPTKTLMKAHLKLTHRDLDQVSLKAIAKCSEKSDDEEEITVVLTFCIMNYNKGNKMFTASQCLECGQLMERIPQLYDHLLSHGYRMDMRINGMMIMEKRQMLVSVSSNKLEATCCGGTYSIPEYEQHVRESH